MHLIRKLPFLLFFLLIQYLHLFGQKPNFINIGLENGLIQSQVIAFGQDVHNELWVGTYGGVSVYDGLDFKSYSKSDGLLNNLISQLYKAKDGRMWLCTATGLIVYDGVSFTNYKFPGAPSISIGINKLVEDENGVFWIVNNGILYQFLNNTFHVKSTVDNVYLDIIKIEDQVYLSSFQNGIQKLNSNGDCNSIWDINESHNAVVLKMFAGADNTMLCLVNNDLMELNVESKMYTKLNTLNALKDKGNVLNIHKDANNDLWVALDNGGVWHYNKSIWDYYNFDRGFTNEVVMTIFEDNQKNIWFGTNGAGIFRYAPTPFTFYDKQTYFGAATILGIGNDSKGNIYIGTTGEGIYVMDDNIPKKIEQLNYLKNITGFSKWKDGVLVSNVQSGLLYLYDKQIKTFYSSPNPIYNQHYYIVSNNNKVYAAGLFGLLAYENGGVIPHPLKFSVTSFHFVNDSIAILNSINAAYFYNVASKVLDTVPILDDSYVLTITSKGNDIYLATDDKGIVIYNSETRQKKYISIKEGLSCNYVYSLLVDHAGNLWAGTGCGIDKISMRGKNITVRNYGQLDGIAGVENSNHAIFEDEHNQIWFGTNKGLFKYDPALDHMLMPKSNLIIQNIKLFSKDISYKDFAKENLPFSSLPKNPVFLPSQNHLTFFFKSILLSGVENTHYRYQLKGIEENATETDQSSVVYANLPPGNYEFRVWSKNGSGSWSEQPTVYPFVIQDYYYNTVWFRLAAGLLLLGIYFMIKWIQRRNKIKKTKWEETLRSEEQDKIRQRTAEDFHDEIGNKLTRINLLSSIALAKVAQHNNEELKNIVGQIQQNATLLYKGSKDIIWSLQPQSDYLFEILERVKLNAEEMVLNAHISFHYDLKMLDAKHNVDYYNKIKLHPEVARNIIMIFKEGVNNIIKHAGAANISLEITVREDGFLIHLNDDGIGIDPATIQYGNGIKNMERRAARINASFHFGKGKLGSYIEIIVPFDLIIK